jgi:pimeloyl-ACP methyl ester carboxylesterase
VPRVRFIGEVFVREWGEHDAPAVIFWPGLGFSSAYVHGVAEALAPRVVAIDPPGFGRSRELEAYTLATLAGIAASVVDATSGAAFVGHSIGARIGLELAADPPAGLRSLVMVDGGYLGRDALAKLGVPVDVDFETLVARNREATIDTATWEEAFAKLREHLGNWTPAAEIAARDILHEQDGRIRESGSPEAAAGMLLAMRAGDPLERAARLTVPTLLLVAGTPRERRPLKQPEWERFAAASPLVDVVVGEEWGHHPFQQAPEESAQLVGSWLRAHL